ncbi:hypothetical protein [Lysinibacillus piscis]|uniref:Uncharacterized protein n=1 Tax=Lysinibacillus piscis TaxID=2518931 RepID=A0ABQ5NKT8_9BACI|nr:hypothetical protein [Lysinibacillus sp. KH24]GLC88743.1 hypothetical protein LYSBPC_18700 [Lysinibacillus sp. KH24]
MLLLLALLFICQLFLFLEQDREVVYLVKIVMTLAFLQWILKIPFIHS